MLESPRDSLWSPWPPSRDPWAPRRSGYGTHVGLSSPEGRYAARDGQDAGGGTARVAAGLDLWVPLTSITPALSWYTSADVAWHHVYSGGVRGRTGGFVEGSYFYAPLMTGLRYDLREELPDVFVTGQAGLVLAKGLSEFYPFGGASGSPKLGSKFGFTVGAGIQLTPTLSLGARYYPLGTVNFDYSGASDPLKQDVSFLEIGFGLRTG